MEHLITLNLDYLPHIKNNGKKYHSIRRNGKHTGNTIHRWVIKGTEENKTLLQMSNSKWLEYMRINGKLELTWLTYHRDEHSYIDTLARKYKYDNEKFNDMLNNTIPQLTLISLDGKTWKSHWWFTKNNKETFVI